MSKGENFAVIVDGEESAEYDVVVKNGPTFRDDGVLEYLVIKRGVLYRVRHKP